ELVEADGFEPSRGIGFQDRRGQPAAPAQNERRPDHIEAAFVRLAGVLPCGAHLAARLNTTAGWIVLLRGDPFPGALAPDQNAVSKFEEGKPVDLIHPTANGTRRTVYFFSKRLQVNVVGEQGFG